MSRILVYDCDVNSAAAAAICVICICVICLYYYYYYYNCYGVFWRLQGMRVSADGMARSNLLVR